MHIIYSCNLDFHKENVSVFGKKLKWITLFPAKRFAHDLIYVISNEPRFWFNALTNLHFAEYLTP